MKKPIFLSRTFWRRRLNMFTDEDCMTSSDKLFRLSSRMRVMKHNWSARKQATASSSAECSHDKPPSSFVRGQDSTMWDIIWVSQQGHRSVSASLHFLLQALQCFCSVREWFSRDHCCRGMSKFGCRIVGSHTRWELAAWANFQLCLQSIDFWCQLVASPATAASWISVVEMVGWGYQDINDSDREQIFPDIFVATRFSTDVSVNILSFFHPSVPSWKKRSTERDVCPFAKFEDFE